MSTVLICLNDIFGVAVSCEVIFYPGDTPFFNGSAVAVSGARSVRLDADGNGSVTLLQGRYTVRFSGITSNTDTLLILVPNDEATYELPALVTAGNWILPFRDFLQCAKNLADVADPALAFAAIKQTATPSASGVVQLATVDEIAAGTDAAKTVTPATLAPALAAKAATADLTAHTNRTDNPHAVTKAQVGLDQVDNTPDAAKPVSTAQQTALNSKAAASDLTAHTANLANPHAVTKAQVGLGNVDNTSDVNKPVSTAQQTALNAKAAIRLYETNSFTAIAYGRYQTSGTGIVVSDPASATAGDIYEVIIASGTATIAGSSYVASRVPVVRVYVSGAWTTLSSTLSDPITLNGANNTAPNQVGQTPASSTLLVRAQADALYTGAYQLSLTADLSAPSTAKVYSPNTVTLPAGTYYYIQNTQLQNAGTTAGATAGLDCSLAPTFQSQFNIGSTATAVSNGAGTFSGMGAFIVSTPPQPVSMSGSTKTSLAVCQGLITFSGSSTIRFYVQQATLDGTNPTVLKWCSNAVFIQVH